MRASPRSRAAGLLALLTLTGCPRGSGIPLREFTIELEAGSEVTIHGEADSPIGRTEGELRIKGPARLTALRDGQILKDGVPVEPAK